MRAGVPTAVPSGVRPTTAGRSVVPMRAGVPAAIFAAARTGQGGFGRDTFWSGRRLRAARRGRRGRDGRGRRRRCGRRRGRRRRGRRLGGGSCLAGGCRAGWGVRRGPGRLRWGARHRRQQSLPGRERFGGQADALAHQLAGAPGDRGGDGDSQHRRERDQHASAKGAHGSARGNSSTATAPPPGRLLSRASPCQARMSVLAIANPRPLPEEPCRPARPR